MEYFFGSGRGTFRIGMARRDPDHSIMHCDKQKLFRKMQAPGKRKKIFDPPWPPPSLPPGDISTLA
jgi:hypothetical protein